MERKTRSGKVPAAPTPPTAGKRKGRKKKSEVVQDADTNEQEQDLPATRRSTRGKNPDQSFPEADESNTSSPFATDTSTITDAADSSMVQDPYSTFVDLSESIVDASLLQIVSSEIPQEVEVDPEINIEPEIKEKEVEDEAKPEEVAAPDESLCNLEQQMSDVILNELKQEEIVPLVEDAPNEQVSEDVEMNEPEIPVENEQLQEEKAPEEKVIEIEVKKEEIDETLADLQAEFMDIEDETPLRRSRRLKSVYVEPPPLPIKTEDFTPIPSEPHQEPALDLISNSLQPSKDEVKSEPAAEKPLVVNEVIVVKPTPQIQLKVDHQDERLKRYETIRDNIYSKKSDKKVCKVNKTMKCDCTITEAEVKNGEFGCQYNCINRLLYIECGLKCRCGEFCDNQQFQRYNYADCSVFDTTTKGFGIRANRDVPAETFIIEYVGEVLDNKQFEKRAKKYSENKNIHYYFMALKSNAIIDATKKGNISRFINHSCDPNAETQKWTVNGELRVGFFSRKDIKEGEEITFDYQYQRYGKEAQQCYCEATNCRGWIGENPLDDEEEDENAESPEVDDTKAKKTKGRKGRKAKTTLQELEVKDESEDEEESAANEAKAALKKQELKRKNELKQKKRQQIDDIEIEGEINELVQCGLKNRHHTIRLSRLIVRAKNVDARSRLLKILINGDLPCRRLFLDYNGLFLLHNWMCDINVKNSIPDLELCIVIMNALGLLPITNKTVLRTSKVLDRVEKLKNLDLEKKKITKEKMTKEEKKQLRAEKKKNKTAESVTGQQEVPVDGDKMDEEVKPEVSQQTAAEPTEDTIDTSQTAEENAVDQLMEMKVRVKQVASELLEKWEDLKEDFKIPKKQKQEIMIVHEREADNDDWDDEIQRGDVLSQDRYKNRFGDDPTQSAGSRTFPAPYKKQDPMVSKQQHRQNFEMKVAKQDTEKRMMLLHENNCAIFGLNPSVTNPLDVPVRVNRVTGEYNTIDGRIAPPPPNHYQFKYEPLTLSTNPDDYFLPPIDLPEHWRFALDEYGRIYYYHEKIRQSQWEAPIKILPLKVHADSEIDSPDSDESTTETEDSEEEELRELLEMLKRKKQLPPAPQTTVNPLILQSGDGDEDELEKKIMRNMMKNPLDQPTKLSQLPQKRINKKKRHGLTTMQFIRPRTDVDKLYGRTESKRYKEVKEKLRQKKRRILKGEAGPEDGSSGDDDDMSLDDSIESRRFVDELDILEKSKKEAEKKAKKPKPVVVDNAEIKRQFRDEMIKEIAKFLQPYREDSCDKGKITNDADFSSLVSKLTFSVLTKESRHCQQASSMLKATDSVKGKTKEYIKKYMGKFEGPYQRKEDEQDYGSILNKL